MFPVPIAVQVFLGGVAAGRQICDLFDDGRFSSSCAVQGGLLSLSALFLTRRLAASQV